MAFCQKKINGKMLNAYWNIVIWWVKDDFNRNCGVKIEFGGILINFSRDLWWVRSAFDFMVDRSDKKSLKDAYIVAAKPFC